MTRPQVREPESIGKEEKETIIKVDKEGTAHFFSEQRGVCSRLLRHPEVSIRSVTLADGSKCEEVEQIDGNDTVTAVRGTGPAGIIKVQAVPRGTSGLADIVSETVLEGGD